MEAQTMNFHIMNSPNIKLQKKAIPFNTSENHFCFFLLIGSYGYI